MYQKYTTEALVLGAKESGEADRTLLFYTRDFGLLRARGSAVRAENSKMRYAVQIYTRSFVSLVKGRRGWRAAGANAVHIAGRDPLGVSAFARIAELTVRLVHGEEQNEYLFAALAEAHDALMRDHVESFATIEIVCVARVLYALGYLSAEALETALFTHTAYAGEHLTEAEAMREKLLASINRAIAQTQL
ncbi:MAG: recombination protein O N-terminal domain-containing protein [Candidatus Kaiserbacteria bacterium]|nr:recombination protein O N-terminal domain-containing protein [Candidatus Kaiserbacteria bacterium]